MGKRLLLGMHDLRMSGMLEEHAKSVGYACDAVHTLEDMLQKSSVAQYDLYMMDANLGHRSSPDVTPAHTMYKAVQQQVLSGVARFISFSNNPTTIDNALDAGIPAMRTIDFCDKFEEYFD